jgi:hypothetical protein
LDEVEAKMIDDDELANLSSDPEIASRSLKH